MKRTLPVIRPIVPAVVLALAAAPVHAAPFQDTGALDNAVAAFTARPIGADGGARTAIDARLKLASCPTVALAWRSEAHDAVVVTCGGPNWRLFVPVIRATPLPAAGAPATPSTFATAPVRQEPVIRRGDPVLIEASANGFSIAREGVAMGDAAPGARFMVRVEDARAPVQAMATAGGRATLPGWAAQ